MLYPIYVHQEGKSAFGASFPDIPGCFTAADDLNDLPRMAQEAVEVYFDGEAFDVPAPGDLTEHQKSEDYAGGFWLLVDIDLTRVNSKPVRLNISLPSDLVQRIDRYAEANHLTRSGFLASAAVRAMENR